MRAAAWATLAPALLVAACTAPGPDSGDTDTNTDTDCVPPDVDRTTVHAFYYPWYATPAQDGAWAHWECCDPGGQAFDPANNDVSATFYPSLGPYSSADPAVLGQHMQWLADAGVGVIFTSWWGRLSPEEAMAGAVLDAAAAHGLAVGFYIEPYGGGYLDTIRPVGSGGNPDGTRTPQTAKSDVQYLIDAHGAHAAMYRVDGRPVFGLFAAREYQNGSQTGWNAVWSELHADPQYDPIVIAHDTDLAGRIVPGDWDGGHEYGCPWGHEASWDTLSADYAAAGKLLVLGVCPGYDDSRIRADGGPETSREDGALYDRLWQAALDTPTPPFAVWITSFNEWHEGTSIEPARPMALSDFTYLDYEGAWGETGAAAESAYLERTRYWSDQYVGASDDCR